MLKLLPIDFLFRTIPEAFVLILAGYAFSGKQIEKKAFCISSILLGVATYLIRMLPIHFGVHTIILIVIYVALLVNINKTDIIKTISAGLVSSIVLFFCEWLNIFMLTKVLKVNIDIIFKSPIKKSICLLPSIMLFGLVIISLFYINVLRRNGEKKCFL